MKNTNLILAASIILSFALPMSAGASTIPFVINSAKLTPGVQANPVVESRDYQNGKLGVVTWENVVAVPTSDIVNIVRTVRTEVCAGIVDGQVTVWLKGEASGKFIGIGASAESGIEVRINCRQTGIAIQ